MISQCVVCVCRSILMTRTDINRDHVRVRNKAPLWDNSKQTLFSYRDVVDRENRRLQVRKINYRKRYAR